MATVIDEGETLLLKLSPLEKLGSFHTSIRVPKTSLKSRHQISNPWSRADGLKGVRAPGTGIPGVIMLGTLRSRSGKDFAAVYGRREATIFEFENCAFNRWIVTL